MVVLLLCMILDIYTLIAYIIINKEIKGDLIMEEKLMVDNAYIFNGDYKHIVVEVNGKYYLIPSLNRKSNDLTTFQEINENVIKNKELCEMPNFMYVTRNIEKKSGHNINIGRSISDKEFEELKNSLKLTEDDISEPFEEKIGELFGEKSVKIFKCVQIKVEEVNAIKIEKNLRKKGIEAMNVAAGRINIRIPE